MCPAFASSVRARAEPIHRNGWCAVLLYRSATLMVSYLDGPQDELEAAMDDFEAALGDAPT